MQGWGWGSSLLGTDDPTLSRTDLFQAHSRETILHMLIRVREQGCVRVCGETVLSDSGQKKRYEISELTVPLEFELAEGIQLRWQD